MAWNESEDAAPTERMVNPGLTERIFLQPFARLPTFPKPPAESSVTSNRLPGTIVATTREIGDRSGCQSWNRTNHPTKHQLHTLACCTMGIGWQSPQNHSPKDRSDNEHTYSIRRIE